ncbi:MAG: hypothetical protein OQK73_12480 [Gammaproteobacteria bacterium]|nr:hypothetical protein [Gammaproteobacteria bacterium]
MNINQIHSFLIGLFITFAPWTSFAEGASDDKQAIAINLEDSRFAYLTEFKINETEKGIEVSGILRHKRHNNQKLIGHVDIELLDSNGQILETAIQSIGNKRSVSRKHEHSRDINAVLSKQKTKVHSIRVRHNVGLADH